MYKKGDVIIFYSQAELEAIFGTSLDGRPKVDIDPEFIAGIITSNQDKRRDICFIPVTATRVGNNHDSKIFSCYTDYAYADCNFARVDAIRCVIGHIDNLNISVLFYDVSYRTELLTLVKRFISEGTELNEQRDEYRKRTVFSDDILKFVCKIVDGLSDKFTPTGGENKWKDKETAVLDILNMLETRYNLNFNELEKKFQEKNNPQE